MSDAMEELRQELQAARRIIAELQSGIEQSKAGQQTVARELEDNRSALLFMLEDLEEGRKKIEQSHREWMAALDAVDDPMFLHDHEFRIMRCNKAYQRYAGVPFREIIGQPYYAIFPKTGAPLHSCLHALEQTQEEEEDMAFGGAVYRSRAFTVRDEQNVYLHSVHILEDVTESRRTAKLLRENEQNYRTLADSAPALIWASGTDHLCNYFNRVWLEFTGRPLEQELGDGWAEGVHPDDLRRCMDVYMSAFERREPFSMEYRLRRHDGEYRWMRDDGCQRYDSDGDFIGYIGYLMDVTERKLAEERMRQNEHSLKEAQRIAHLGSWNLDLVTNALTWSDEIYRIFELDPEKFGASYEAFLDLIHPADRGWVNEAYAASVRNRAPYDIEHRLLMPDGRVKHVNEVGETYYDADGKALCSFGVVHDITTRKQAEASLEHASRALATLGAVNRSLVHVDDEAELLQSICRAIVEQRGYRMAWVGYRRGDDGKPVEVMAHAGHEQGYFGAVQLTWAENEYGMVPSGRAIRSGVTQLCQDIAAAPAYQAWRGEALGRGYLSSIALPLKNGEAFGVLTVYAEEANAFTSGEVYLLEEMADDLAFGVRSLHTRHERDAALEQNRRQLAQLQGNLEDTVRAIATIVEMRDPYTAGHQAKVADLAAAIARQMGMSGEQAHGLHLAGVLHDLGKIHIPAEILSKPGKLSDIEYMLIKTHPQAGYDILKGIDFPWPVAQMVLQHHERLDGSGYPQGLKGEQIIPEARILSVADVVEAISAHRPYRPGFGVDAALEEITRQRGIHFDLQVVDACLSLFREQGYSFK